MIVILRILCYVFDQQHVTIKGMTTPISVSSSRLAGARRRKNIAVNVRRWKALQRRCSCNIQVLPSTKQPVTSKTLGWQIPGSFSVRTRLKTGSVAISSPVRWQHSCVRIITRQPSLQLYASVLCSHPVEHTQQINQQEQNKNTNFRENPPITFWISCLQTNTMYIHKSANNNIILYGGNV